MARSLQVATAEAVCFQHIMLPQKDGFPLAHTDLIPSLFHYAGVLEVVNLLPGRLCIDRFANLKSHSVVMASTLPIFKGKTILSILSKLITKLNILPCLPFVSYVKSLILKKKI